MSICTVLDNNTKKFQDILKDNAAAAIAVAWANNNFDGDINTKTDKAIDFIDKLKASNPKSQRQAESLIKKMSDKGLVAKVNANEETHYATSFPEIVNLIISGKSDVIFSGYGNPANLESNKDYNYIYSKKPLEVDSSFMAEFDEKSNDDLSEVGKQMLGFVLMSTDGIVSSEKVNQTVDTIVEKIARRVIDGETLSRADIQEEMDVYRDSFLDIKDEFVERGSEKGIAHIDSYINNWNNLESMVLGALKRRSGLSFKNGIDSKKLDEATIQDEESIKQNNDDINLDEGDKSQGNYAYNFAVTLDSKVGLSGKLKLFLSTLENGTGHYLTGEPLFENFDTVYNSLNAFLAGSEPNIYEMIERLKVFSEYDWVKNLIDKLNEARAINKDTGLPNNMTLVKQFVTAMNKHYIDMAFVQWANGANGSEFKVMGDNANSRKRVVLADWKQRLEMGSLVNVDSFGKRTFNPDSAKVALDKFESLFESGKDVSSSQLYDALNSIGVKLSFGTIDRLLKGHFQYRQYKFKEGGANQLFLKSDKFSPITNIYNTLKKISETDGNKELDIDSNYNIFSSGSVDALADFEARYSKHLYSNSHRSGTKTVFSYTNDKFIVDRVYELTRGYRTNNPDNYYLLDQLSKDVFAKDSYWLSMLKRSQSEDATPQDLAFMESFDFGYLSLDPLKRQGGDSSDRGLTELSAQEIIAIKLGLLHNNDAQQGSMRVGKLFYPTMSDKTNMITIQSLIKNNILFENNSVDDDTIDFIYDTIVKAEMNRMWEVQKSTNNYSTSTNIEGYDKGSKYFYTVPELNIVKEIFKRAQNGNRVLKPEDELTPADIQLIKDKVKLSINLMIRNQINEFAENKIGFVKGEKTLQFIDKQHGVNVSGWYGRSLNNEELSNAIAADFAVNYFIHNANVAQLFHGDYAQYFKGEFTGTKKDEGVHGSFEKNFENLNPTIVDAYNLVKPTFDNLGKRLAADLAPGYEADFGSKKTLRVTTSKDRKMKSLSIDYIDKVFRKNEQGRTAAEKSATKAWTDINTSDAQSWVSLDFHLDTLFSFGNKNITEAEYYMLKKKISDAKNINDVVFSSDELSLILQPTKPLYSNNRQAKLQGDSTVGVRSYIKTSSFPLIPQLVRGTELEHVMNAMHKNNVDMHVFESGFKVGATDEHVVDGIKKSGKIEIFNEDGSINVDNVSLLGTDGNFIDLDIRGFKIQQEVPYHDHPGEVNRGTQESKLLFSNIKGIGGFKYNGKTQVPSENKNIDLLYSEILSRIDESKEPFVENSIKLFNAIRKYIPANIIVSENQINNSKGYYDFKENLLYVSKNVSNFKRPVRVLKTLNHELIHSISLGLINKHLIDTGRLGAKDADVYSSINLTDKQKLAIEDLIKIHDYVKSNVKIPKTQYKYGGFGEISYGLNGVLTEFVSEAFSNPDLINNLKQLNPIFGKQTNIFKEFLDSILKLFGINNQTILDDIYGSIEELIVDNTKTYNGAQLEEIYNNKYKEVYLNEAIKLKDELFEKDSDGNPKNSVNFAKLQEILLEEANGRGYSINDVIGLDLNEFDNTFKYPLWALPSAKQYESLIISIVDNRVRKLKIPGNSFVLGSEAGFNFKNQIQSGKEGLDTIKKYQDRIIFTSNFNGESLQSYREDGDGMKPSQVFVPMKLKGSNGEFIDLMKYTFIKDGKIMLDEDRLPKDLLKLFGFRIPTQGHNSMAALEIAGFLPAECGDLIIASQDLVVQMGSDFDVDKLFTYNYLTKEVSDNGVPKIIKDNDGSLYNDLLDIHLAVFNNNNKELYSLVLAPNGFGKLKIDKSTGLSFDIEKIKQDANGLGGMTSYLSPQYQMMKFFNGTSGKVGVGVMSSLSMLNAICQGKDLTYIDQPVIDGKRYNLFDIQFGNLKSVGKLGELKTLDGKSYISKVIEAFQSASVDNEKEQILYKLNINKTTFPVINALAMLGFDEDVICYFINQPIIEEFVRRSSENDSSLNTFKENLGIDLYDQIKEEYVTKYSSETGALKVDDKFKYASVEELKEQMKLNIAQREIAPQEFWDKQLAILEKFKYLNKVGLNLQSLMQTVNAESKGLGKTIFGSIDREQKIDNIDSVSKNYSLNKSATGVLGAGKILDNTLNGFVADYGTRNLNILGSQIFPYKNEAILKMFKYASGILEREVDSISKNEEFMTDIFQAVKSYLFSNINLFGGNENLDSERKRLFLGKSKVETNGIQGPMAKTNLVLVEPSLAETITAIKDTKFGQSNALLRTLSTDLSQRSSEFKLVKYMASTGQNLDESDLHQAFISLFRENVNLEYKIGGKKFTKNSKDLALDLIKYTYLSGGIQEAIQFTRYIPIEVLNYIGFSDKLKSIGESLNHGVFGNSINESDDIYHSNMIEQFIQHNPKLLPVKLGSVHRGANLPKGIKDIEYTTGKNGVEVISSFKPIISEKASESTGNYLVGKKYVAASYLVSQPNEKAKYEQVIYKWNGESFVSIPVLGSFGVNEYSYGQSAVGSIIPTRKLTDYKPTEIKDDRSGVVLNDNDSDVFANYKINTLSNENIVESLLVRISETSDNDNHIDVANSLLENSAILNSLKDVKFSYSQKGFMPKGRYNFVSKTLIVNGDKNAFRNIEHFEETLLHETTHAYLSKTIRLIDEPYWRKEFPGEFEDIPQEVLNAHKKIDSIRRGLVYSAKLRDGSFSKSLDRVRGYINQQSEISKGITISSSDLIELNESDILAYGLLSNNDFVTMATTNEAFRNKVDELSRYSGKTNIFKDLWNALLDFLGLSNLSQLTKDYVSSEIFQYINTVNESKSESQKITQPTKIFDNEKYKEVEKLFEEIENELNSEVIERNDFVENNNFEIESEIEMYKSMINRTDDVNLKIAYQVKISSLLEKLSKENDINKSVESKYSFTYKGKTIPTEFQLTNGQIKALERLIDFVQTGKTSKIDNLMTLQGYAGTGKTTIIGYLQKYFSRESTFVYMAPTHAATVELSMATSKTGNKSLAMTVASGFKEVKDFSTMTSKKVPSKKLDNRLGYFNNVLVIDEVSMLNRKDYETVKAVIASGYKDMKVIFMGDMMQIPEVDANNPKEKQVSLAFSELENVELTEVKRTEDVGILNVLTAIRKQKSDLIPTIPNTNTISYLSQNDFDKKVYFTFKENPENTVMISYTNPGAKGHNKRIRQSLGRTGDLIEGDIIVGFGGYNSKQVENSDIVNSIRYTVDDVEIDRGIQNVAVNVTAISSRLEKLKSLGVGVSGVGKMKYLQLSLSDSFTFGEITRDDMDLNNQFLSKQFERVLSAKNAAILDKRNWPAFFTAIDDLGKLLAKYNVGADYVYNTKTKSMEVYDYSSHASIVKSNPEMKVEKGVDYGHAITIHKSQGSTVENVFFDSNTLPKGSSSILMKGQNIVGSEKKSLIYVALSRASKNLYINKVDDNLFYELPKSEILIDTQSDFLPQFNDNNRIPFNENSDLYTRFKLADGSGKRIIFKSSNKEMNAWINKINATNPNYHAEAVNYNYSKSLKMGTLYRILNEPSGLNDIFLEPTEAEVVLLKQKHGPDALERYNKLTPEEKESVLRCLK